MNRPIIIAICFFISLTLGAGVIRPKYQDLNELQGKVEELRTKLQSKEEYLGNLSNISEELKNYQEALSKINSALPADPSLPVLFGWLQTQAAQSGLVLKGITPLASVLAEGFSEVKETQLTLITSGSYPSFKNFLQVLEKSARLIEMESISFSAPEREGPLTFNLRIKFYSY